MQIAALAPLIPVENPRLNSQLYDLVLTAMRQQNPTSSAATFLQCVKQWSGKSPPVFDRLKLLAALEDMHAELESMSNYSVSNPGSSDLPSVWYYLEAQALLYSAGGDHAKALNCYLEIKMSDSWLQLLSGQDDLTESAQYRHVFDLIEKKNLFSTVSSKIINLLRLSKPLSRKLLVGHIDKLPINVIAAQLAAADKRLLLWYLDALFADAFEAYSSSEYMKWHIRQIELYVEFSPVSPPKDKDKDKDKVSPVEFGVDFKQRQKSGRYKSPLLQFLQSDLPSPTLLREVALPLCSSRLPQPLFHEMAFILSKLGDSRKALQLYLKEIGNLPAAIDFIEEQATDSQPLLWKDLVDHCLQSADQLAILLDYMGLLSTLDPVAVISRIAAGVTVPDLKLRLLKILRHAAFREYQRSSCVDMLEDDALTLLRQKNQGLRRAIKVEIISRSYSLLSLLLFEGL